METQKLGVAIERKRSDAHHTLVACPRRFCFCMKENGKDILMRFIYWESKARRNAYVFILLDLVREVKWVLMR